MDITPRQEQRFWLKVDKDGPVPTDRPELGPCWLWKASTTRGYGQVNLNGQNQRAHRVAWELEHGTAPVGEIDHLCHERRCVRPSHLEDVTHIVNVRRGRRRERSPSGRFGSGTVTERKPGTFTLRVYLGRSGRGGSPRYKQETYVHHRPDGGIQEARRRLKELVDRVEDERGDPTSFARLLDDWLSHAEKMGRSPSTLAGYRWRVRDVKAALGDVQLEEMSARHLDRWYAELLEDGRSPADIRAFHRIVSAALNQAERWDLVERNVARRAKPPRVPRHEIRPPSPAEVSTLIRFAERSRSPEMAPLIFFAALTGMRRGELVALRWDRVDWDEATVRIDAAVWQHGIEVGEKDTKTHQARTLAIGELGISLLRARQARALEAAELAGVEVEPDGFVWSSDPAGRLPWLPQRITHAFSRLRTAAQKAEGRPWPPYRFHDLRHYSATELLGAGVDLATVSERLGHALKSTTSDIYGHGRTHHDQRAADILSAGLVPELPA